jgi:uncharacterized protein YdaU (DUF1376 family)
MNYFEKHIGDWIRDTVSLTMLEDGAYNRLIDQYYQTERPLPVDKKLIYRLARANSSAEKKAVDFVVENFFEKTDSGYVQKRANAELERYSEKRAKAKSSANARWNKSDGNANAYTNASLFADADDMRTHCDGNALQTPDTSNQRTTSAPSDKISLGAAGWEHIPDGLMTQWREAYPAANIDGELAKAAAWVIANPRNRKSNYARFLTNWLTKAQDRAPRANGFNGHSDNPFV